VGWNVLGHRAQPVPAGLLARLSPAIATALLFAVQEGAHLVQIDGQVLTVGGDPLERLDPGAHRRRAAGVHARVAYGGAEHPTPVW
jgi:hypothetical protein